MKEKGKRLKSYVMVGIPSLILIYFLGIPFLWVYLLSSIDSERDLGRNEKLFETAFTPPVWLAERFRPYFEYWRMVDGRFGSEMLPTWEEMQESLD